MKASPAEQEQLLRLQSLDTRLAQLAHKLGSLPQAGRLAEFAARDQAVRGTRAEALGTLEDARVELKRLESDVAIVEARIARDSERLQHTSSVKDVSALESELASLRRRLNDLEEQELVVMERVEEADVAVSSIDLQREAIVTEVAALEAERDEAAGDLGVQREQTERDRAVVAEGVAEPLLAFYEQRRVRGGGVGAALLRARTCGGCGITLTGSDLESVRRSAPDEVVLCPECDRILVRTDESGL